MDEQVHSWDDLRVLLAVARAGSLSGAARMLNVSHPTVFRRLNQIERQLGVRLFERGRGGYSATPAGEELAALAERMESDLRSAERRIAGRDLRPSGTIRVTTTDTLLIGLLSPVFADFRRSHAEIDLSVAVGNELFSISRRDADVAIRPSKAVPDVLVGRKVSDIGMAVYALAGAGPRPDRDVDLHAFHWVGPDESLSYLPMAKWLREQDLERRMVYRANTLLGCYDAVRSGIGVGVLPCHLGDGDGSLVRVGAPVAELGSELWLLTHPDLRNVARIRAFLDFMAEALRPYRASLAGTA